MGYFRKLDQPMSAEKMKSLKSLALDQGNNLALYCINADEWGMIGQYTLAFFHQRFNELEEESATPFGCIPSFNFFGDIFQLGAICDRNLYDDVLESASSIIRLGHSLYNEFVDVVVLDQIMRQKPDQIKLLNKLDHKRSGNVTRHDWEDVDKRVLSELSHDEKRQFENCSSNVICLTETWEDAKK